jgi:hypothetical protein
MDINNTEKETITTVGVVIPVEWEENGRPVAFAISSYEEKEYLIDLRTKMGKKLSTIEKQKIRVTGTLGRVVKKRRVISVKSYEQFLPDSPP